MKFKKMKFLLNNIEKIKYNLMKYKETFNVEINEFVNLKTNIKLKK